MNRKIPSPKQVVNKKEYAFWKRKVKLLSPKKGDILVVPSEAHFDFGTLAEALKHTPILYALVVPEGNANLMSKEDATRFAAKIQKKHGQKNETSGK